MSEKGAGGVRKGWVGEVDGGISRVSAETGWPGVIVL